MIFSLSVLSKGRFLIQKWSPESFSCVDPRRKSICVISTKFLHKFKSRCDHIFLKSAVILVGRQYLRKAAMTWKSLQADERTGFPPPHTHPTHTRAHTHTEKRSPNGGNDRSPVSLMKIRQEINKLAIKQHSFWHSRASNSEGNNHYLPEFELIWDFMNVLIICKFDEDQIKINKLLIEKH